MCSARVGVNRSISGFAKHFLWDPDLPSKPDNYPCLFPSFPEWDDTLLTKVQDGLIP